MEDGRFPRAREFFKSFDRYAQVVSLTYKKSGRFETAPGGIATIILFLVLTYWLVLNLFFTIHDNGTFLTSQSLDVTQLGDGTFPLYSLNGEQLFIAYRVKSFLPDIDVNEYI